jgi:hypothetical protein
MATTSEGERPSNRWPFPRVLRWLLGTQLFIQVAGAVVAVAGRESYDRTVRQGLWDLVKSVLLVAPFFGLVTLLLSAMTAGAFRWQTSGRSKKVAVMAARGLCIALVLFAMSMILLISGLFSWLALHDP